MHFTSILNSCLYFQSEGVFNCDQGRSEMILQTIVGLELQNALAQKDVHLERLQYILDLVMGDKQPDISKNQACVDGA